MLKNATQKMGVVVATAMSVTIVVGAGLLALPGLSYAYAGRYGYIPWLLVAGLMLPLLEIFAYFGKTYPSAGGVVGYIRASLGHRMATMSEVIVLGTFSLGIPAIALIGAGYLQQSMPSVSLTGAALGTITVAFTAGLVGLRISGAIQTGIALLIVLGLVGIGAGFLLAGPAPVITATVAPHTEVWRGVAQAIPVILFAFTGWEMTAFLAEDMENPQRDMPRSIWASFVVVTALYVFIAWIVASHASPDDHWKLAPVAQLAKGCLGDSSARWIGFIAALLVVANVLAAFFSASRAIFSAGREGLLPRFFGQLNRQHNPARAMALTYAVFVAVVLMADTGLLQVDTLLQLAGQNFFVLYLLAAVGYTRINQKQRKRWIGYVAIGSVLGMLLLFSASGMVYCSLLAGLGWWLGRAPAQLRSA